MKTRLIFISIFCIFNIHIHIPTVIGGCYQFKLCCKSRNASCVSFETGSSYNSYYTIPSHVISTRLPRDWNPENFPGRKRSYPIGNADYHHVTNQELENLDLNSNSNSTNQENNSTENENGKENFLDYSTTSQSTVQVRIRTDQSEHAKSQNLIFTGQSESIFEILNETEPSLQNVGPFQDSGPFQDESSGQYDDLMDYGSGMQDVTFLGVNFLDGQNLGNDSTVFDNNQYENSQYHVIDAVSDRNHKRRHTVDLMTDYTGKTKEISYLIVGEKNHISFDSIEKIGLLQPDKNVARLCYCDEQCGILNDCCSDYQETCPARDCVVSPWSSWGHCSTNHNNHNGHSKTNELEPEFGSQPSSESESACGPGISLRTRKVVQESENGGAACPHLEEQKACYSADADTACGHLASEMALLLPYIYSDARQPGYKSSVYYDLPRDSGKSSESENYCSIFLIHWYSSNCSFGFDNKVRVELNPGDKVCVECQSAAKKRNFYLTPNFNGNHNGPDHVDQYADSVNRCSGDGVKNIETLWSLVAAKNHQCFGQWTLIEKIDKCQCDNNYANFPKFIFV